MQTLQQIISKAVDIEFQTLISLLMKNPDKNLTQVLQQQEIAIDNFIRAIRKKMLKQITSRYKQNMDNAYFACADEGFAVQSEEILPELIKLENRLPANGMDIRILNDLSIGYSCAGDLDKAVQYLDSVLRYSRKIWKQRSDGYGTKGSPHSPVTQGTLNNR